MVCLSIPRVVSKIAFVIGMGGKYEMGSRRAADMFALYGECGIGTHCLRGALLARWRRDVGAQAIGCVRVHHGGTCHRARNDRSSHRQIDYIMWQEAARIVACPGGGS